MLGAGCWVLGAGWWQYSVCRNRGHSGSTASTLPQGASAADRVPEAGLAPRFILSSVHLALIPSPY